MKIPEETLRRFEAVKANDRAFIENCLSIKDKQGALVRFVLNRAQDYYWRRRSKFDFVLKARKEGISSFRIASDIHACAFRMNQHRVLLTHTQDAAAKMMQDRVKPLLLSSTLDLGAKPLAQEVYFPATNSRYYVGTAGSRKFGRGDDVSGYHFSEFAHWENPEVQTGVEEACIDNADGMIETTANGVNFAKLLWDDSTKGMSRYKPVFIPWFLDDGYRIPGGTIQGPDEYEAKLIETYRLSQEQLAWRRWKLKDMSKPELFPQEFPSYCITGDALICTENGIITLAECKDAGYADGNRISRFSSNGRKRVYEVRTGNGRHIKATADHRFETMGGWKELRELKIGDQLVVVPATFSKTHYVVPWNYLPGVQCEININEDWGRFLGYFMGDGSFYFNTISFCCDKRDIEVHEDIRFLCRKLLGIELHERTVGTHGGGLEFRAANAKLQDLFSALGIIQRHVDPSGKVITKRLVKVPDCILRSPRPVVASFLSALFECDGCAYPRTPRTMFFSKYGDFVERVNLLLTGFGINAMVGRCVKKSGSGKDYVGFELALSARNSNVFHSEIGFISARKRAAMRWNNKEVGRRAVAISWTDSVSGVVELGEERVFDLTIPASGKFGANGVSVHNCEEAWLSSDRMVFDWSSLLQHEKNCEKAKLTGMLRDQGERIEFLPNHKGNLKVWRTPEARHVYVIGADVAEGIKGGAYSAAFVLDVGTSEQVAEWQGHCSPSDFGAILATLGYYYNRAMVAPEGWPGPGAVTVAKLREVGYSHLYQRPMGPNTKRTEDQLYGWETTAASKQRMVSGLYDALRNYVVFVKSKELLLELRSYVYTDSGKMEPGMGCFSDRVIALAIAWEVSRSLAERVSYAAPRLRFDLASARLIGVASVPQWRGPILGVRTD